MALRLCVWLFCSLDVRECGAPLVQQWCGHFTMGCFWRGKDMSRERARVVSVDKDYSRVVMVVAK